MERSIRNAEAFAHRITTQPNLELMAPIHLDNVRFRVRHGTNGANAGDLLNASLIESIQVGGIAYVSGTRWSDSAAIRAAFDNWATTPEDVVGLHEAAASAVV